MTLKFAKSGDHAIPLHVIEKGAPIPDGAAAWAATHDFTGGLGQTLAVPDADGGLAMALVG